MKLGRVIGSVWATRKGERLHAILLGTPTGGAVTLAGLKAGAETRAQRVGGEALPLAAGQDGLRVELGPLPDEPAHAIALDGIADAGA